MQINTNISALNSQRMLTRAADAVARNLQRLSSGLRVNSARDDAAGLAISDRMTSQIRGANQAARNAMDALSMLQTGEGALAEVANLLQRGRDLALQAANATYGVRERQSLQAEIDMLVAEVDRIGRTADFNGVKILGGGQGGEAVVTGGPDRHAADKLAIVDALKRSWLREGEALVERYFGIRGDGADIQVRFVDDQGYLAAVSFTGYEVATGRIVGMSLNVDLSDFVPADWPNGSGSGFVNNDRVIAHELTHAIMGRAMNMHALPLWFVEGAAEFIHGADSRLLGDLMSMDGANSAERVQNLMDDFLTANGSVQLYSAGYAALRYMHSEIIANGGSGIREVFEYLAANQGSTLDDALAAVAAEHAGMAFDSVATLTPLFAAGEAGNAYIANLLDSGSLENEDTGAVGGADSTPGGTRNTTNNGVVPDHDSYSERPLRSLNATFEDIDTTSRATLTLSNAGSLAFQVGANANETITIELRAVQASTLNLNAVNVVDEAQYSISVFDAAIDAVAAERGRLGAVQNRMEIAIRSLSNMSENLSASRSRIIDADYAADTADLTRNLILRRAGIAMVAQANARPAAVLQLLR